jgi:hypothetical protein
LFESVLLLTSHPSKKLPLQLRNPMLQKKPHAEAWQVRVELGTVGQTLPQLPQLLESELLSISHPFAGLPSQLRNDPVQVNPHVPKLQVLDALATVGQAIPQPLQLFRSLLVFTSHPSVRLFPLQSAKPDAQAPLHCPPPQPGTGM